jgi:hypothetical protein
MKIDLPIWVGGLESFVPVEAELLPDIAPHLADVATFALHNDWLSSMWNVTNVETGLYVAKAATRAKVIKEAKLKLAAQTSEKTEAAYDNAAKKYGLPL